MTRFFQRSDFVDWPPGVSDGLASRCQMCSENPRFDFHINDDAWLKIVPKEMQAGVICLPCLDRMAIKIGMDANQHLREVQFTGENSTVVLLPGFVVQTALDRKEE